MGTRGDAAALMNKVLERIKASETLHCRGHLRTEILFIGIGPLRVEAWYRTPQWRIDMALGQEPNARWIGIFSELNDHVYVFSDAEGWTKRRREPFTKVSPEEFKLRFFNVDQANAVIYTSLAESLLQGEPVWVVHGVGNQGERFTWWIRKDGLVLKKAERKLEYSEFEYAGEKKQLPMRGETVFEFEVFELDVDLPEDLFQVPPDAPLKEATPEEMIFDRLLGFVFEE